MLYALRTTFTLGIGAPETAEVGRSDRFLSWLLDTLPARASMGADVAVPHWFSNRYDEDFVIFELVTYYRNVFAAAADQLRIQKALDPLPPFVDSDDPVKAGGPEFKILRVLGEGIEPPTKKTPHP